MKRKKSKYKFAVIDKKKYYFYKIIWLDILGDSGHATIKEFDEMKPAEMVASSPLARSIETLQSVQWR
jgi:hypothetical protein